MVERNVCQCPQMSVFVRKCLQKSLNGGGGVYTGKDTKLKMRSQVFEGLF